MEQKDEEKLVITLFRKSWTDFPKGRLIASESPDYILKLNRKRTIGIELTRILNSEKNIIRKIYNTISAKNQKHMFYNSKLFSAIWLIIYADDIEEMTTLNLGNKLGQLAFRSDFDRVFLLSLFSQKVYSLQKA